LKEKDASRKQMQENAKLHKVIKDLRNQLESQHQRVLQKDQDLLATRARLESRQAIEEKTKERDLNIFAKHLGRKPVSTNSQDQKLLTIVSTYEDQKAKLERRAADLQRENAELREQVLFFDRKQEEILGNQEAFGLKQDKVNADLREKLAQVDFERADLKRKLENTEAELRCKQENFSGLFKEHQDLRKAHERLKTESVKHHVKELNETIAKNGALKPLSGRKTGNEENENPNIPSKRVTHFNADGSSGKKSDRVNAQIVEEVLKKFLFLYLFN
jgi:chromosome segregation ATPase